MKKRRSYSTILIFLICDLADSKLVWLGLVFAIGVTAIKITAWLGVK